MTISAPRRSPAKAGQSLILNKPMKTLRIVPLIALAFSLQPSAFPQVPISQLPIITNLAPADLLVVQTNAAAGTNSEHTRTISLTNLLSCLTNLPGWPAGGSGVFDLLGAAQNATNGLNAALAAAIQAATNAATLPSARNATNGLGGLAAFFAPSAFDSAGSASAAAAGAQAYLLAQLAAATNAPALPCSQNATNGLINAPTNSFAGTLTAHYLAANGLLITNVPWAAISAAPAFDAAGAALNATNALNLSAFTGQASSLTSGLTNAIQAGLGNGALGALSTNNGLGLTNFSGSNMQAYANLAGPISVGTQAASNSVDSMITVSRLLNDGNSPAGVDGHAFSDSSIWAKSNNAYASFDARITIVPTNGMDHYAAYQAGPTLCLYNVLANTTNNITNLYSFVSVPVISTGAVKNAYGFLAEAPVLGPGATVTNLYSFTSFTGAGDLLHNGGKATFNLAMQVNTTNGTDITIYRTNFPSDYVTLGMTDNGTKKALQVGLDGTANFLTLDAAGHLCLDGGGAYSTNQLWVQGHVLIASNFVVEGFSMFSNTVEIASNSLAAWPSAPMYAGACAIVNSNGYPYMLLTTNGVGGGSAAWTGTNRLGW